MLDFGAVRMFEGDFLERYFALARGAARRDVAGVEDGALGLGLLLPDDSPAVRAAVVKLAFLITEPLGPPLGPDSASLFTADGSYRWGESDLPRRAMRRGGELVFAAKLRTPPREMIFLDRKLGGLFFFLSTLKAVLQARPLVDEYLSRAAALADSGGARQGTDPC